MGMVFNILVPGSGLILLRREWLGASLAVVFGVCGHIAVAGWLIAPAAIPRGWIVLAILLASIAWLSAQVLYRRGIASSASRGDSVAQLSVGEPRRE